MTTVVETNIHYPTDSSLLGDGARVLTRTMKKIETQTGRLKRKVRNRARGVSANAWSRLQQRVDTRARKEKLKRRKQYKELLRYSSAADSQRHQTGHGGSRRDVGEKEEGIAWAVRTPVGNGGPGAAGGEANQGPRVRWNHAEMPGKIVSLFEPDSEIIRVWAKPASRPSLASWCRCRKPGEPDHHCTTDVFGSATE